MPKKNYTNMLQNMANGLTRRNAPSHVRISIGGDPHIVGDSSFIQSSFSIAYFANSKKFRIFHPYGQPFGAGANAASQVGCSFEQQTKVDFDTFAGVYTYLTGSPDEPGTLFNRDDFTELPIDK